jgi:hypothetical protein
VEAADGKYAARSPNLTFFPPPAHPLLPSSMSQWVTQSKMMKGEETTEQLNYKKPHINLAKRGLGLGWWG